MSFGCRLFSRDETFDGEEARAATSRLAPATHQHRAPVRARRVGVRAIAAVRIYVRVAEDPHRASLDVEPVRFERGLQDVRRSRARLEGRQGTPRLRGERARHAEGDEREAGEAEASCHLPDAAREGDRERERVRRTRARVSRESGEQPKARVFSYTVGRWKCRCLNMTCLRKKSRGSTARARASARRTTPSRPPRPFKTFGWFRSSLRSVEVVRRRLGRLLRAVRVHGLRNLGRRLGFASGAGGGGARLGPRQDGLREPLERLFFLAMSAESSTGSSDFAWPLCSCCFSASQSVASFTSAITDSSSAASMCACAASGAACASICAAVAESAPPQPAARAPPPRAAPWGRRSS